jgi:uncharacterized RDD family membrane protein YckC
MTRERSNALVIKTPEGVAFSLLLAGPLTRFLAWIIDLACVSAAASIVGTAFRLFELINIDFAEAIFAVAYFVLQMGYGMLSEWLWRGQTVGKRLLRLRVVDAQGMRLRFNQTALRNLLRFIDMLPAFYLVGGIACALTKKTQRLGDLAANTIVIREPKIDPPDLDQLLAGKFNSFRKFPHLEARLRQRVEPAAARLALQALLRREQFTPEARVELFAQLGEHFRSLVEFPPEIAEGLSDEQYIRNAVDTLFRPVGNPK